MNLRASCLCVLLCVASASLVEAGDRVAFEVVGTKPLGATARAALARLNDQAAVPFGVVASPAHGAALTLYGGRLGGTADRELTARSFVSAFGDLFGIESGLTIDTTTIGTSRVDIRFARDGVSVDGAVLRVMLDAAGAVIGASSSAPQRSAPLGSFTRTFADSEAVARQQIAELRERHGKVAARAFISVPDAVYQATADGLLPCHRVGLVSVPPAEAYAVYVDARNGQVLRVLDEQRYGTGNYPFSGALVGFETGTAEGLVYSSLKNAIKGKANTKDLKNWAKAGLPDPVNLEVGFLVGAHVDIWDANDAYAVSAKGKYKSKPNGSEADLFDQANVYYQIEQFNAFLTKHLGTLEMEFSLPVIINNTPASLGEANAFFSPTTFPIDGHTIGFLSFDDLGAFFGDASEPDFCRDPTVVDHEYTHALLNFHATPFQDVLDSPTRAVGEAIPDFFAATYHDETGIGQYLEAVLGEGLARDLQDDDHFPQTTLDAMDLTGDLPEEHRNGEIFGSLLVDLSGAIGDVPALQTTFTSLPFMPVDMAAVGVDTLTAMNAVSATAEYFGQCAFALLASVAEQPHFGDIIGCATGRGLFGQESSALIVLVELEQTDGKAVYNSRFVAGTTEHRYYFRADQGRTLNVKIVGSGSGDVKPDFTITDDSGDPAAVTHNGIKKSSDGGRIVKEGEMVLNLALSSSVLSLPYYELTVTTEAGKEGKYKLTLSVE